MYSYELDKGRALLVSRLASGGDEQADFVQQVDRMLEGCRAQSKARLAILSILERDHALPSPKTRKLIAAGTARPEFRPHLCVVTGNPMIRGVLTALSWLRQPDYEIRVAASVEDARAWLEAARGEKLPELTRMLAAVSRA